MEKNDLFKNDVQQVLFDVSHLIESFNLLNDWDDEDEIQCLQALCFYRSLYRYVQRNLGKGDKEDV